MNQYLLKKIRELNNPDNFDLLLKQLEDNKPKFLDLIFLYMSVYLLRRRRLPPFSFTAIPEYSLHFFKTISKTAVSFKVIIDYKRLNTFYTIFLYCSYHNKYTLNRNYNIFRSTNYGVTSSLQHINSYSTYRLSLLSKYLNSLVDEGSLFHLIYKGRELDDILARDLKISVKSRSLVPDGELNSLNYYYSERFSSDRYYFYVTNLIYRQHFWRITALITTLGFLGRPFSVIPFPAFKHIIDCVNHYNSASLGKPSLVMFLHPSSVNDYLSKCPEHLKGLPSFGLIDFTEDESLLDFSAIIRYKNLSTSYVLINLLTEHFLIGQRLRHNLLKTSYRASKIDNYIKKAILINSLE